MRVIDYDDSNIIENFQFFDHKSGIIYNFHVAIFKEMENFNIDEAKITYENHELEKIVIAYEKIVIFCFKRTKEYDEYLENKSKFNLILEFDNSQKTDDETENETDDETENETEDKSEDEYKDVIFDENQK